MTVDVGQTSDTFAASDTPLAIPDADDSGVISVITVASDGILTDLNVRLER